MTDFHEIIRSLQNELEQTKQELKRKEKQVESLKKTNKIQEGHVELQRKKIADLQNKKPSIITDDESQKHLEMMNTIDRLNGQMQALKKDNKKLSEDKHSLKQANSQLNDRVRVLEGQVRSGNQRIKSEKQRNESGAKQIDKKVANLQSELLKSKKKISDLQKEVKNLNSKVSQAPKAAPQLKSEPINAYYEASSKVQFFAPVLLTESMDQNHAVIPDSHVPFFKRFEIYLTSMMPQEKIRFLNIMAANVEMQLENISEQVSLMTNIQ